MKDFADPITNDSFTKISKSEVLLNVCVMIFGSVVLATTFVNFFFPA
jgi:uncharacterized membrane protein YwzB